MATRNHHPSTSGDQASPRHSTSHPPKTIIIGRIGKAIGEEGHGRPRSPVTSETSGDLAMFDEEMGGGEGSFREGEEMMAKGEQEFERTLQEIKDGVISNVGKEEGPQFEGHKEVGKIEELGKQEVSKFEKAPKAEGGGGGGGGKKVPLARSISSPATPDTFSYSGQVKPEEEEGTFILPSHLNVTTLFATTFTSLPQPTSITPLASQQSKPLLVITDSGNSTSSPVSHLSPSNNQVLPAPLPTRLRSRSFGYSNTQFGNSLRQAALNSTSTSKEGVSPRSSLSFKSNSGVSEAADQAALLTVTDTNIEGPKIAGMIGGKGNSIEKVTEKDSMTASKEGISFPKERRRSTTRSAAETWKLLAMERNTEDFIPLLAEPSLLHKSRLGEEFSK